MWRRGGGRVGMFLGCMYIGTVFESMLTWGVDVSLHRKQTKTSFLLQQENAMWFAAIACFLRNFCFSLMLSLSI